MTSGRVMERRISSALFVSPCKVAKVRAKPSGDSSCVALPATQVQIVVLARVADSQALTNRSRSLPHPWADSSTRIDRSMAGLFTMLGDSRFGGLETLF